MISGERGTAWVIDALGCDPALLRAVEPIAALFERIVRDLDLHPLGPPQWHVFPGAGGLTGVFMLRESHLTCHTFPERGFAALDLYCCRERGEWPWASNLAEFLGAHDVSVRSLRRG
jgi:S-adenosylmethionine decarboxylase